MSLAARLLSLSSESSLAGVLAATKQESSTLLASALVELTAQLEARTLLPPRDITALFLLTRCNRDETTGVPIADERSPHPFVSLLRIFESFSAFDVESRIVRRWLVMLLLTAPDVIDTFWAVRTAAQVYQELRRVSYFDLDVASHARIQNLLHSMLSVPSAAPKADLIAKPPIEPRWILAGFDGVATIRGDGFNAATISTARHCGADTAATSLLVSRLTEQPDQSAGAPPDVDSAASNLFFHLSMDAVGQCVDSVATAGLVGWAAQDTHSRASLKAAVQEATNTSADNMIPSPQLLEDRFPRVKRMTLASSCVTTVDDAFCTRRAAQLADLIKKALLAPLPTDATAEATTIVSEHPGALLAATEPSPSHPHGLLSPAVLPSLVEHNPHLAAMCLQQLWPYTSGEIMTEFLSRLVRMDITIHSMEAVSRLAATPVAAVHPPPGALPPAAAAAAAAAGGLCAGSTANEGAPQWESPPSPVAAGGGEEEEEGAASSVAAPPSSPRSSVQQSLMGHGAPPLSPHRARTTAPLRQQQGSPAARLAAPVAAPADAAAAAVATGPRFLPREALCVYVTRCIAACDTTGGATAASPRSSSVAANSSSASSGSSASSSIRLVRLVSVFLTSLLLLPSPSRAVVSAPGDPLLVEMAAFCMQHLARGRTVTQLYKAIRALESGGGGVGAAAGSVGRLTELPATAPAASAPKAGTSLLHSGPPLPLQLPQPQQLLPSRASPPLAAAAMLAAGPDPLALPEAAAHGAGGPASSIQSSSSSSPPFPATPPRPGSSRAAAAAAQPALPPGPSSSSSAGSSRLLHGLGLADLPPPPPERPAARGSGRLPEAGLRTPPRSQLRATTT